jgi:hypothetical protein
VNEEHPQRSKAAEGLDESNEEVAVATDLESMAANKLALYQHQNRSARFAL